MNHIVIGTAGHIDHGKTALIKALTGINADRLKEEQERGMTIDLGFAHFNLPSGRVAEIIDVPGHERFVKNMLAGTSSIDVVLLVIAANEGVMPQTREHLDILKLLDLKKGMVVLTKADLVDQEWLELARETVKETLVGSFLESAPIVETSTVNETGLKELVQQLDQLTQTVSPKNSTLPCRLPIDRVFTKPGFGTTVTGTLVSGELKIGDTVEILPQKLSGRIRQLGTHGQKVDQAVAGQRVGISLSGIKRQDIVRGNTLVAPDYLSPTHIFDATLEIVPSCPFIIKNNTRVRLHIGSGEFLGRIILLDQETIKPGNKGFIQFRSESPLAITKDDRFVIRRYSPMVTIGGGKILDPHAGKHKRLGQKVIEDLTKFEKSSPPEMIEQILLNADSMVSDLDNILNKINLSKEEVLSIIKDLEQQKRLVFLSRGNQIIHRNKLNELKNKVIDTLGEFHKNYPLRLNITKKELKSRVVSTTPSRHGSPPIYDRFFDLVLDESIKENKIKAEHDLLRLADHTLQLSPQQEKLRASIEQLYLSSQFSPPDVKQLTPLLKADAGLVKEVVSVLIESGILVALSEGIIMHRDVLVRGQESLKEYFKTNQEIRVGQVSKLLNSSRKYAVPILQYFDGIKLTRRMGDIRVLNTVK